MVSTRDILDVLSVTGGVPKYLAEFDLSLSLRDHALLQRDCEVRIWGTADLGATIDVRFAGQTKTAVALTNGAWRVTLDRCPPRRKAAT